MDLSVQIKNKILDYREKRASNLLNAFKTYNRNTNFSGRITTIQQYSLIHHLLLKTFWFKTQNELYYNEIGAFSELLQFNSSYHNPNMYFIVPKRRCIKVQSDLFDSPIYLLDINSIQIPDEASKVILEAVKLGFELGFNELISYNLGTIILLEDKIGYEASNSYTVSVLPGTIFIDVYNDIYKVCEMIIHECSHVYFNDVLASNEENFDRGIEYWSVWKATNRPIIGILHAAYTFSNVIIFYQKVLTQSILNPLTKNYLESQLQLEIEKIKVALPQIMLAAKHLKSTEVRQTFFNKIELALQDNIF